jgi:hypothetical protein
MNIKIILIKVIAFIFKANCQQYDYFGETLTNFLVIIFDCNLYEEY